MDNNELSELALMQNGTEEERDETWYMELEDLDLAFWEDTRDLYA